ncbi:PEGA domain-containing protein [Archangium sp.]|uniref:PEGA domain-containing protein n=1 Tax=Archangium sp. TaxID=1872627 RepID=UPI0038D3D7E0
MRQITPTPLPDAGPPPPKRRTGWLGALTGLALLFVGSGVLFSRTLASSGPIALQESSPVPVLQESARETKPEVEPASEKPEPRPEPAPVKATTRQKGSRVVAPPSPPTPPSPPLAPEVSERASLEFRIRPYATVLLDGKHLGQTPLSPAEVEVGTHTVLLINHALGKKVSRTVEVKAGQLNVFKHNLLEE